MHTFSMGQHQPRQAVLAPGGAAAARELQRFARGAPPLAAVPLVKRKLHTAARSLASEEAAAATAATAAHPIIFGTATSAAGLDGRTTAASGDAAANMSSAADGPADAGSAGSSGGASTSSSSGGGTAGTATPSSSSSSSGNNNNSSSSSSSSAAASDAAPGARGGGPAAAAPPVLMLSGASMLPHPDKAHRGGEDAFFISDPPLALGVADGVGGWAEIGVDAGAYARLLMSNAKEEAQALLDAAGGANAPPLLPQTILERAYYRTNVQGSSTVCVLTLNGSTLCASNLGDSGFVIVRDGAPAFQSPQQQHNFNFPYQIGSADGGASDHPQSAMRFELAVQPGDVIIVGTDGLWDNVFAEEAATIVARCKAQGDGPEAAAHTLCRCGGTGGRYAGGGRQTDVGDRTHARTHAPPPPTTPIPTHTPPTTTTRYARMRATDPKYHSPFSYAAIQAGYVFLGGKLDDITVVVSYVSHNSKL
jgi:protein phosphatase PTC7